MSYVRNGLCVFKKNPDGSKGAKKGCSKTVAGAKKYMKALYHQEGGGEFTKRSKK